MRTISLLTISVVLLFTACRKSKTYGDRLEGVWVESSLRLDTFDFDAMNGITAPGSNRSAAFNTNTYTDAVLNPVYPVNHSTIYNYYFNTSGDSIYMYSMLSSLYRFYPYTFSMNNAGNRFTIGKFYARRSLPVQLEFVRIR